MLQKRSIMIGIWLGMMTGSSLFIAESFFMIHAGKQIPFSYLSFTFFVDFFGGLFLGLLASSLSSVIISIFSIREGERQFDLIFSILMLFLIFSLGFFFLHGRILKGSRFYEWKGLWLSLCWILFCFVFTFYFYHLLPKMRKRIFQYYPSCLFEIMFLVTLASGDLWLDEHILQGSTHAHSILIKALFLMVLALIYLMATAAFSKWASHYVSPLKGKVLSFASIVLLLSFIGITIFWFISYPDSDSSSSLREEEEWQGKEGGRLFNVILISVDTLRASHLSCYGYPLPITPHIDRFAEEALIFTHAVSNSSWTLPAHASLFTGLIPCRHGAHYADRALGQEEKDPLHELDMAGVQPLHSKYETIAEVLKEYGYTNVAFVSNFAALSRSLGLDQGFDIYVDRERTWVTFQPFYHRIVRFLFKDFGFLPDFINRMIKPFRKAREITDEAIRWLKEQRREPFFLFLNYMEPHTPYLPDAPFNTRFIKRRVISMRDPFWEVMGNHRPIKAKERDYLLSQYAGEVAYADLHIGRLFRFLKSSGLYDPSMIILLSDHGELFGEHNLMRHTSLYEEVLKIPLIIKYPFSRIKGREDRRVSLVDIMPEILKTLEKEPPDHLDGAPFEKGNDNPIAELYVNPYYYKEFGERFGNILRAKYKGPFKLIVSSSQNYELYDLDRDPKESKNLSKALPEIEGQILKEMERALKEGGDPDRHPEGLNEETRKKLRSLGYID